MMTKCNKCGATYGSERTVMCRIDGKVHEWMSVKDRIKELDKTVAPGVVVCRERVPIGKVRYCDEPSHEDVTQAAITRQYVPDDASTNQIMNIEEAIRVGDMLVRELYEHQDVEAVRSLVDHARRNKDAMEFIADHLEGQIGLLSCDDFGTEFGTNENLIPVFNKVMEAQRSTRRVEIWHED